MVEYQDLASLDEDERIQQIGCQATLGNRVAFCVDSEPGQAKAKRYKEKLLNGD